jgi:hypothetical protein
VKKLVRATLIAASLFAFEPFAASAQEMPALTMVQARAEFEDPQWASEHAADAQTNLVDYAREWRLHESQQIIRLDEGGA